MFRLMVPVRLSPTSRFKLKAVCSIPLCPNPTKANASDYGAESLVFSKVVVKSRNLKSAILNSKPHKAHDHEEQKHRPQQDFQSPKNGIHQRS